MSFQLLSVRYTKHPLHAVFFGKTQRYCSSTAVIMFLITMRADYKFAYKKQFHIRLLRKSDKRFTNLRCICICTSITYIGIVYT